MKHHKREAGRDLVLAYNTGAFSRASNPKPLSYYMRQLDGGEGRSVAAGAIGFFSALKEHGFPIEIKRVPRAVSKLRTA